jgi:hypothetical protein
MNRLASVMSKNISVNGFTWLLDLLPLRTFFCIKKIEDNLLFIIKKFVMCLN